MIKIMSKKTTLMADVRTKPNFLIWYGRGGEDRASDRLKALKAAVK
jgi:hypothetical protein